MNERFELEYVGADNNRHRPIMLHRALFGSVERFFGVLLEHYAGNFPTWLAPLQVRVLPVATAHEEYAAGRSPTASHAAGGRVDMVHADDQLGKRIRASKLEKIPYILVVGDDDVAADTVGVNPRGGEVERGVGLDEFVARFTDEVASGNAAALDGLSAAADAGTDLERLAGELRRLGRAGRRRRDRAACSRRSWSRGSTTPRPTSSTAASAASRSSTPSRTAPGTCSCCRTARSPTSRS